MSTYGAMLDRIQDETLRTDFAVNGTGPIAKAVQSAIKHYEGRRFFFNEVRSVTFSLSSSQEFYGVSDNASIPHLIEIDAVTVTLNANRYGLVRRAYQYLEEIAIGSTYASRPNEFSYYNQQLRFYPIPNTGALVRLSGVVRLATLSATGDTNAWMTDAEALIRSRAKWDLYTHVIQDAEMAAAMKNAELEAEATLFMDSSRRLGTGRIVASHF